MPRFIQTYADIRVSIKLFGDPDEAMTWLVFSLRTTGQVRYIAHSLTRSPRRWTMTVVQG